jgi:hypothetical protein
MTKHVGLLSILYSMEIPFVTFFDEKKRKPVNDNGKEGESAPSITYMQMLYFHRLSKGDRIPVIEVNKNFDHFAAMPADKFLFYLSHEFGHHIDGTLVRGLPQHQYLVTKSKKKDYPPISASSAFNRAARFFEIDTDFTAQPKGKNLFIMPDEDYDSYYNQIRERHANMFGRIIIKTIRNALAERDRLGLDKERTSSAAPAATRSVGLADRKPAP